MSMREWHALEQMAEKRRVRMNMAGELAIPEFEPSQGQARTGDVGWFEDEIRDRGAENTRAAGASSGGRAAGGMDDAFGMKGGRWDIPNFRERMKVPTMSFEGSNKREIAGLIGGGAAVLGLTGLMAYMEYKQGKEDIELQDRFYKAQEKEKRTAGEAVDDRADMKLDGYEKSLIGLGVASTLGLGLAWYADNRLRQEDRRVIEDEIGRMEGRADMAGPDSDDEMFQLLTNMFEEDPSIFPTHHEEELESVGRQVALRAMQQRVERGEDLGSGQKMWYPYQNPMGELRWLLPEYTVTRPGRADMQPDSNAAEALGLAGGNPMEHIMDRERKHLRADMAGEDAEFAGIAEAMATGIVAMAADAREAGELSEEDIAGVADLVDMVLEVSVAVEAGQDPGEAGAVVSEFLESNIAIADAAGEIGAALLATEGE